MCRARCRSWDCRVVEARSEADGRAGLCSACGATQPLGHCRAHRRLWTRHPLIDSQRMGHDASPYVRPSHPCAPPTPAPSHPCALLPLRPPTPTALPPLRPPAPAPSHPCALPPLRPSNPCALPPPRRPTPAPSYPCALPPLRPPESLLAAAPRSLRPVWVHGDRGRLDAAAWAGHAVHPLRA